MLTSIPALLTPPETEQLLAERFKTLRLQAGYKRITLAARAGVSPASLKRFKTTGQVSLKNLLRLAHALGRLPEFADLFAPPEARSLAELRKAAQTKNTETGQDLIWRLVSEGLPVRGFLGGCLWCGLGVKDNQKKDYPRLEGQGDC